MLHVYSPAFCLKLFSIDDVEAWTLVLERTTSARICRRDFLREFRSPRRDVVVDDNSPRNQISRMRMLGLERAYTSADAEVARFAIT